MENQDFDIHDNVRHGDNGIFDNYYKQSEMMTRDNEDQDAGQESYAPEDAEGEGEN